MDLNYLYFFYKKSIKDLLQNKYYIIEYTLISQG